LDSLGLGLDRLGLGLDRLGLGLDRLGLGLDSLGLGFQQGQEFFFFRKFRLAVGPTCPLIQLVPGFLTCR